MGHKDSSTNTTRDIYVNKSGEDNYTGIGDSNAVATLDRSVAILLGLFPTIDSSNRASIQGLMWMV